MLFPVRPCKTLFKSFINPVCPDLRRTKFIALTDETEMENIDTRPLESNECFILGRAALHMGWEERGFGTPSALDEDPRTPIRYVLGCGSSASGSSSE
jgi:hypothetical protein